MGTLNIYDTVTMFFLNSAENPSLHTRYTSKKLKEKKEKKEKILKPEVLDKAAAEYKGKLREAEVLNFL